MHLKVRHHTEAVKLFFVSAEMESRGEDDIGMEELVSIKEAARRLGGISVYTVQAWLSSGKLRRTKVGARTMLRVSELERVIADGGKSMARRREPARSGHAPAKAI